MPKGIFKRTEEHKKHISESLKGKMPKYIPDNKGIKRTEEHKKQISETLKRKNIVPPRPPIESLKRGKDHPQWKGGVTPINEAVRKSAEYKKWRKDVFERDNYTCVRCGLKKGMGIKVILQAHHIKPFSLYPEHRLRLDNGETLCICCHKKTATYGVNNCVG